MNYHHTFHRFRVLPLQVFDVAKSIHIGLPAEVVQFVVLCLSGRSSKTNDGEETEHRFFETFFHQHQTAQAENDFFRTEVSCPDSTLSSDGLTKQINPKVERLMNQLVIEPQLPMIEALRAQRIITPKR